MGGLIMNTIKVVTPSNLGNTLKKGSDNKFQVNLGDKFSVNPSGEVGLKDNATKHITGVSLVGTELRIATSDGASHNQNLAALVPTAKKDAFLSNVELSGNNLVLTVTNGGSGGSPKVITVDVSELLPVKSELGIEGDGTNSSKLKLKIVSNSGLKATSAGLDFDKTNMVKLTDVSGQNVIGYAVKE